ncbi:helix-turn-helix domain-containing protein [Aquimarina algiphila]|uniref:Helix-turn-helix domain-containing protein n=1 Tax=Aquimarina algiphila TaxID=2047982 RepID=A0A554VLV5_9FLAO|nr:AraC family transcriptional regulator [Aquimarina algiphila]TSE09152.1 helix-turn-helix domain-containing protein [Aquimarina algiphila]
MENLTKNFDSAPLELYALKDLFKGKITKEQDIYVLTLGQQFGYGEVRYTGLQKGLKAFDFNILTVDDIEFPINSFTTDSLQFLYCLDGFCSYKFEDVDEIHQIDQFQTAVVHSRNGLQNRILIPGGKRLVLNIIFVNKREYFDKFSKKPNQFGEKLQELLQHIDNTPKHFHSGSYSLKIAEQLKLLIGIEYTNEISELLSQKGRYYLILAKQIEKFCLEIDNNLNTSGLLKNELKMISELSDFIKRYPEIQHSIKTLCHESGLSPAKLQEGFKFMFERTVSDFVRNVRLEKAEKLIQSTDLTISEIVYSVGLTSRSYFCKIFKKKYHYSPKEYKSKKTSTK